MHAGLVDGGRHRLGRSPGTASTAADLRTPCPTVRAGLQARRLQRALPQTKPKPIEMRPEPHGWSTER